MFFGAYIVPILLVILFNIFVFISSSYVVIKHRLKQQKGNKPKRTSQTIRRPVGMPATKEACRLLLLLASFVFLLGLSWVILLLTIVGPSTDVNAAFVIQLLFVFFNSLQGFFLFVFFVIVNRDARQTWLNFLRPHFKVSRFSTQYKHSSTSGNTASTKLTSYKKAGDFGTLKAAVERNKFSEELIVTNYASAAYYEDDELEAPSIFIQTDEIDETSNMAKPKNSGEKFKKQPQVKITRSSTLRKIHDVVTAELKFESESDDDETNL